MKKSQVKKKKTTENKQPNKICEKLPSYEQLKSKK